jgi:assimilatory nitrate reductase catalytic subunit
MPATATHCPYCSLQCGIALRPTPSAVRLEPTGFDVNRGGLCAKGWTAAELLHHPDRLLTPLIRKNPADRTSPLREATWDEALDRIVTAIRNSQRRYGKDSVGAFGGGGLTNEKAYALGKFVRVALGSASIDYNGRFCMSSAATAANRASVSTVDCRSRSRIWPGHGPCCWSVPTRPTPCHPPYSIWTPDAGRRTRGRR